MRRMKSCGTKLGAGAKEILRFFGGMYAWMYMDIAPRIYGYRMDIGMVILICVCGYRVDVWMRSSYYLDQQYQSISRKDVSMRATSIPRRNVNCKRIDPFFDGAIFDGPYAVAKVIILVGLHVCPSSEWPDCTSDFAGLMVLLDVFGCLGTIQRLGVSQRVVGAPQGSVCWPRNLCNGNKPKAM